MKIDILFYAFRYVLGRMTYAVTTVVEELIVNWDEFDVNTQILIKKEILEAISDEKAGMQMDVDEWEKILKL